MELSFSLDYLRKKREVTSPRSIEDMAALCHIAGFRYVDYSPDFRDDEWEKLAHHDRLALDRAEIRVEQTHAPFNRYRQYRDEDFPVYYRRLFEASKILGAKYVVVHADEYRTVSGRYDYDEILNFTYDYLAPFVEYAEKNGMIVAVENVFEDKTRHCPQIGGRSRFTSTAEELKAVIEKFNTPSVACCWDFGHAKCAFGKEGMLDAMKKLGKYIVCTHVHDNYYEKDLHLMPFMGDTPWEDNLAYLKEIGYQGKLSFEFAYGSLPEELLPVWLNMVYATGEYMLSLYNGKNP